MQFHKDGRNMRHSCVLFMGLFFGGCVLEGPTSGLWNRIHPFQGLTGADVIQLDVAVLEAPVADPTLNQGIWKLADELELSPETQTLLEKNGIRVGLIGGIAPKELQSLLTSERSCVFSRRIQLRSGSSRSLALGPAVENCRFTLQENGGERQVDLDKGRYVISVVPTLISQAAGGPLGSRTQLHFVPEIQFGPAAPASLSVDRSPLPTRSSVLAGKGDASEQRPTERYPNLSWTITLAPNEYALIGTWYDRSDTLGWQSFIRPEETTPVQRLLVVRTTRSNPDAENVVASGPSIRPTTYSQSPSLAAQASGSH
jgi:hypothetical protein